MPMHHLSCHCGAVSLDIDAELKDLMTCNCSLCGRTGSIMVFVPFESVSNLRGADTQTDYQFGQKRIHHRFCPTCGVRVYGHGPGHDGREWAMINVRCVEGLDVHTLEIARRFDGKVV